MWQGNDLFLFEMSKSKKARKRTLTIENDDPNRAGLAYNGSPGRLRETESDREKEINAYDGRRE